MSRLRASSCIFFVCVAIAASSLFPSQTQVLTVNWGRWSPWETWQSDPGLLWDSAAALLIGTGSLLTSLALWAFGKGSARVPRFWATTACGLGLGLLAAASEGVLFVAALGFSLFCVALFAAPPARRDPPDSLPTAGATFAGSLGTLVLALIATQNLFNHTDWPTLAKLIHEPYDYDPWMMLLVFWTWIVATALLGSSPLALLGKASPRGTLLAHWWLAVGTPLWVAALCVRFEFLKWGHAGLVGQASMVGVVASCLGIAITLLLSHVSIRDWYESKRGAGSTVVAVEACHSTAAAWLILATTLECSATQALWLACGLSLGLTVQRALLPIALGQRSEGTGRVGDLALRWAGPVAVLIGGLLPLAYPWFVSTSTQGAQTQAGLPALFIFTLALWAISHWIHSPRVGEPNPTTREALSQEVTSGRKRYRRDSVWLEGDARFWQGIWLLPGQACKSAGAFFAFWGQGSAQYGLVVLLLGTLVLFWAVLKTQVVW